jgi:hypothetical protein
MNARQNLRELRHALDQMVALNASLTAIKSARIKQIRLGQLKDAIALAKNILEKMSRSEAA